MLKKRGQVSTFVIIGVLVLFVFIFVFMLRDSIREKFRGTVDREGYLISQMNQIKKTINTCLVKETDKAVKLLGESGGYFNPEDYVTYHGTKIAKLCENIPQEKICNAKPLSIENTNKVLKNYLQTEIKNCIDLNPYRKKDYTLESGELNLEFGIGDGLEMGAPPDDPEKKKEWDKKFLALVLSKAMKQINEEVKEITKNSKCNSGCSPSISVNPRFDEMKITNTYIDIPFVGKKQTGAKVKLPYDYTVSCSGVKNVNSWKIDASMHAEKICMEKDKEGS